jgi:amino-acid N-acetyltransferase
MQGPSVPMVRRHARTDSEFHYAAAMNVVSGNYVAARRLGVVNGTDYGYTGAVRFVHAAAIHAQLATKNVVLLSNLGYSAAGELLNCNTFDVAVRAAVEVSADKVICMHMAEVAALGLPEWLSVNAARSLLQSLDPGFDAQHGRGGKPVFLDSTDYSTDFSSDSSADSPEAAREHSEARESLL